MYKNSIAFIIALAFMLPISSAHALSCLPIDMYLESVIGDETTLVFTGTATEAKNHAQVVTVTKAHQGWVAPKIWVNHPYSEDWKYFCSNGPAEANTPTIFFVTVDEFGSFSAVQTLKASSEQGKDFLADIAKAEVDAGITEATPQNRADELMLSMRDLMQKLLNMLAEFRYWEAAR